MTVHRVQLKMCAGGGALPNPYKYSYVWFADVGDVAAAADVGLALWDILQGAHNEFAFCYAVHASDVDPLTPVFTEVPVPVGDQRGTLTTGGAGDFYNPNTAVMVNLLVAGGFPSRKWHRVPLIESWVASGGEQISLGSVNTAISGAYAAATAVTGVCDESGNAFIGASPQGIRVKRLGKLARVDLPAFPAFG